MAQGEQPSGGLELNDILLVLLKHKWKILFFTILGLGAAGAVYMVDPPLYQSEAKLIVKYVIERNPVDAIDSTRETIGRGGDAAIGSELQILSSWDLAIATANAVGPERLMPDGKASDVAAAAGLILKGLDVGAVYGTNIIRVSFKHRDPKIARDTLEQLLHHYKIKHLALHRSKEAYEAVTREKDAAKGELTRVEETLKDEKREAQIVSLPETVAELSTALARTQLELYDAETARAEQNARVMALEQSVGAQAAPALEKDAPASSTPTPPKPLPSSTELIDYQMLAARLGKLRSNEVELLTKFLPGSSAVQLNGQQIATVESQMKAMEKKSPELAMSAAATGDARDGEMDLPTERIKLQSIEARLKALNERLDQIRARATAFADVEPRIAELLRTRELTETTYKLISDRLKRSEIDASLSPDRMPNMAFVQEPSPAFEIPGDRKKAVKVLAGGGIGLGLLLAFLIEMVLNRTVKRPLELETRLGLPLMLSIPYLSQKHASKRRRLKNVEQSKSLVKVEGNGQSGKLSPWEVEHFIRPFAEAVRDRLVLYFELSRLTRKPKLVAVTGLSEGAGVSTLAGGLAAALSETGDGKVLLVDMHVDRTEVQSFVHGQAACSLVDALQPSHEMAAAADNLYLATVADSSAGPMQLVPKRFYELIPHLKASAFDYIIFDMPPLNESSATLAIAGFMDKVLFVVEAEKNNVDTLKRSIQEMTSARANVAGIFNKGRTYAPKWLNSDL